MHFELERERERRGLEYGQFSFLSTPKFCSALRTLGDGSNIRTAESLRGRGETFSTLKFAYVCVGEIGVFFYA